MAPPSASPWLLWQLADSAFPTGGFAHSWGLEAAWQHGEVPDADALREFLRATILQTGRGVLPLLNAVYRDGERLAELDAMTDAFLTNPVANRASRVQGRTLVATCARVWPSEALEALETEARALCGHAGPLSGAVFRAVGLPLDASQRIVLYLAARGVLSAAIRLGIVGAYEAQRLQHAAGGDLERTLEICAALGDEDVTQTAPVIDLIQAAHDRLYSRLFQS